MAKPTVDTNRGPCTFIVRPAQRCGEYQFSETHRNPNEHNYQPEQPTVATNGEIEKGTTVLVEAEYLGEGRACIIGIGAYGTRPTVTVLPGRMYVGDMQHLVAEIERLRAENQDLLVAFDTWCNDGLPDDEYCERVIAITGAKS